MGLIVNKGMGIGREEEKNEEKTGQKQGTKNSVKSGIKGQNELELKTSVSQESKDEGGTKLFENQPNVWLTTEEAAKYLRISPRCLLNLTSTGKIQYFIFGRRNRFLLSVLDEQLLAKPRGGSYGN